MTSMIWVVFAVFTGAAVLAVLLPLARLRDASTRAGIDKGLYEAEIAGMDRDVERGLATEDDARAAKAEAARRLIAAHAPDAPVARASTFNRRLAALVAIIFIPAVSLGLYRYLGAVDYADQPLEARLKAAPSGTDINVALARIEKHLAEQPEDARGWEIIAPVYMKLGRPRDAARAWQKLIQIQGVSVERASSFGEALVYAEDGRVTPQAKQAFEAALKEDEKEPRARFFLGMAAEQDGDKQKAIDVWTKLLADFPPDAPFASAVRDRIVALGGDAPAASGPASPAGAAIAAMSPEDRDRTIRGMVDGLASRLAQNGADLDGWLRLVRAYSVLREPDKARAALADARKALGGDGAALGQLDALSRELGYGG
jgi:cytochrome c-type biogenesis protein CcmH